MAKNFAAMYKEHVEHYLEYQKNGGYRIKIPDFTTEKMSCWTYADMKREFTEAMNFFANNGFTDEAVSLAERCIRLQSFHDNAISMTENAMLFTIFLSEAYKANYLRSVHNWKSLFDERINVWKSAPKHGLVLSPEEQAELDRDIEHIREMIRNDNSEAPPNEKIWFYPDDLGCDEACRDVLERNCTEESTKIMRQRLSAEAYAMITEYEREPTFTDPDDFEKRVLLPKGLRMTDKLRDFIEIYDKRVFAWQSTRYHFNMDVPFSRSNYDGFSISFGWNICLNDGKYYISTMDYHYAGDWGPHICEDGKIYNYISGTLELAANSIEEFLEMEAREYFKDRLVLERRRELENKYLIPEIRTAGM